MDKAQAPPSSSRSDLDFLREEGDVHRFGAVKVAAVVVGAIAIGALGYLLFKPQTEPVAEAKPPVTQGETADTPPPFRRPANSPPGTSYVEIPPNRPSFWIRDFSTRGDLISNAHWDKSPQSIKQSLVSMAQFQSQSVRIQDVDLTVVNLSRGTKRAVGKAMIVNGSGRNVIFYRFELLWGAETYVMVPLQGSATRLAPVYDRVLKPGQKASVQIVSSKITNYPDGSPTTVRLWAWLDGSPDSSVDDYQIQLGR